MVCAQLGYPAGGRGWITIEQDVIASKQILSCPASASDLSECSFGASNIIFIMIKGFIIDFI